MNHMHFGTLPSGESVELYELKSDALLCRIMTRGAAIVDLIHDGVNIVGGFSSLDDYLSDTSHQGALIGRVANRVGGAAFTMDGVRYSLPDNDGGNCLHGGRGFDRRLFTVTEATDTSLSLTYRSEDGEEGFPSAVNVRVIYTLCDTDLILSYDARPEGKTPIALTNHAYFNLDGLGGTVDDHEVYIDADRYTEVDASLIPTGERPRVDGTRFDLRVPVRIGDGLTDGFVGYDHNYLLNGTRVTCIHGVPLALAARISNGVRTLSVFTDQPCMQFYTGNFLAGEPAFRGGTRRVLRGAFCMETQTEPDAIRHGIGFYDAGEVYRHTTVYRLQKGRVFE
ncbi:MAG: galactose mutarotase [Clostridia bacterium]|nr:galactose mutarotase [Clostridia bacterium]